MTSFPSPAAPARPCHPCPLRGASPWRDRAHASIAGRYSPPAPARWHDGTSRAGRYADMAEIMFPHPRSPVAPCRLRQLRGVFPWQGHAHVSSTGRYRPASALASVSWRGAASHARNAGRYADMAEIMFPHPGCPAVPCCLGPLRRAFRWRGHNYASIAGWYRPISPSAPVWWWGGASRAFRVEHYHVTVGVAYPPSGAPVGSCHLRPLHGVFPWRECDHASIAGWYQPASPSAPASWRGGASGIYYPGMGVTFSGSPWWDRARRTAMTPACPHFSPSTAHRHIPRHPVPHQPEARR